MSMNNENIEKADLKRAKTDNLHRLAKWLSLTTDSTFSHNHLVRLIWWRLKKEQVRVRFG